MRKRYGVSSLAFAHLARSSSTETPGALTHFLFTSTHRPFIRSGYLPLRNDSILVPHIFSPGRSTSSVLTYTDTSSVISRGSCRTTLLLFSSRRCTSFGILTTL
ncbi:hypothetical protein BS17DRAFT_337844 [Gyrodon lividus]|nr:hypothetical protein BS17DRAFT_337844 [Gyrodon lividus]